LSRPHGPEPGHRALARYVLACLCLAASAGAQVGTIQREQKLSSLAGGFVGAIGNDYRFGVSVADVGDFDGDGIRDLAVGSHRADLGGEERGALWLLFLNADGTVRQHQQISSITGGLSGPLDDHDRFGISVCSLGDLDLDGTTDLAVGTYRDDDGGTDYGCVYVLFLTPQGTVKAEQKISALAGGFAGTLSTEDSFGWSVENIGDLDGDGVIDLAVGATRDDGDLPEPTWDFGAVYILFMNPDGTVKSHTEISATTPGFGSVLRPRDRFGADVVLLEDADGDGVQDLAVGAFGEDPLKTGKVFVLHMNADGSVKDHVEIGQNTGGFTGVLGKGDRFGISLAADDLDGDGLHDLLVGAAGDDDGGAEAGAIWVCLLNANGRVKSFEKISSDFGGFGGLLHPGDNFGISCTTLGDIDRDGAVDLAVGAYQDDDGGFDRGAAWILFRAGTGVPVADFASAPNSGEAPLTVSFGDRSSGQITAWSWDFGDGTTSTEASPVHVFTTSGVRDVSLTVQGPTGSDVLLRHRAVVVQEPTIPVADFQPLPEEGLAPLTVAFQDLSGGQISSWSWDFGDGTGSSTRQPKHTYADPGLYTVSLTVAGTNGVSNLTRVDCIAVLTPPPQAEFDADLTAGVGPLTVAFHDLSQGLVSAWLWDLGDGVTSIEPAPVHTYTSFGSFDVALTVSGPDGSTTRMRAAYVSVLEPLTADFTAQVPTTPAPATVQFTDTSRGGATGWTWDFGDGSTSSAQSPAHVYAGGGTYLVQLTVTGPGGEDTTSTTVQIVEPVPTARFSATPRSGLVPLEVAFRDTSIGNVTSWLWDFGDGSGSTQQHPTHVYRWPGTYTVRFRVWSAGGLNGVVRRDFITVVPRTKSGLGIPGTAPILK